MITLGCVRNPLRRQRFGGALGSVSLGGALRRRQARQLGGRPVSSWVVLVEESALSRLVTFFMDEQLFEFERWVSAGRSTAQFTGVGLRLE